MIRHSARSGAMLSRARSGVLRPMLRLTCTFSTTSSSSSSSQSISFAGAYVLNATLDTSPPSSPAPPLLSHHIVRSPVRLHTFLVGVQEALQRGVSPQRVLVSVDDVLSPPAALASSALAGLLPLPPPPSSSSSSASSSASASSPSASSSSAPYLSASDSSSGSSPSSSTSSSAVCAFSRDPCLQEVRESVLRASHPISHFLPSTRMWQQPGRAEKAISQTQQGEGLSPLDSSLISAVQSSNAEVVKQLLRAGANLEILRGLLQRCKNADVRAANDSTPLMWAAQAGNLAAVELLLEFGSDVNATSHSWRTDSVFGKASGQSALHWAAEEGHMQVVMALLQHGAISEAQDERGKTADCLAKSDLVRAAVQQEQQSRYVCLAFHTPAIAYATQLRQGGTPGQGTQ